MLADIGLGEAKLIGEYKSLLILGKRLSPVSVDQRDRDRKETQLHHGP